MSGRVYVASFQLATVTTQLDVFELVPAAEKPLELYSVEIGQTSEIGDAGEEQLDVRLKRMVTITSGSGGSVNTSNVRSQLPNDTAFAGVMEIGNTTKATATTTHELRRWAWNVRMPYLWIPTPETRYVVAGTGNGFVLELAKTPADQIDAINCVVEFAELV